MGMVMRNHDFFESCAYPYGFAPEVEAWREFSSGPNPPFFSTGRNGRSVDRRSKGVIPALRSLLGEGEECASNSVLGVASPLAVQQQFRSEDMYQSNWYRESASDIT
ncbi:hypothetical protein AYI68_g5476 [Smittium mucronatum]|uniref:Uncharacterized protein n=1 Tax=Smittium mucronatum TaxID=133383 RepID=A0A1R0GU72_9FUNG|nr:hypothetical protein AYI68_g5476 [Smittium mucronatum]